MMKMFPRYDRLLGCENAGAGGPLRVLHDPIRPCRPLNGAVADADDDGADGDHCW